MADLKLSVAMITYNHERFIAQAIQSALEQQTDFDYEIVIGEDCSTDRTCEIVMDFHRRYPERIRPLLRDENVGGLRNIESTLGACRGQYVAFLEGDDYWLSADKARKQVEFLDSHPESVICCSRVRFLDQTRAECVVYPMCPAGTYGFEDLLKGNFVVTCSVMMRRELSGPLPVRFSQLKAGDWVRYALAARHGSIEVMDEITAVYRVHPRGLWSSLPPLARSKEIAELLTALNEYFDFRYTDTIRPAVSAACLESALAARQDGDRIGTAKLLASYIRWGGLRTPFNGRQVAGLLAYALIGSGYKIFSRANLAPRKGS